VIRAAIFDGPGQPLRVEPIAHPILQSGEALVRVSLCTVCGSDLHTFTGRRKEKTPSVLGHEPVGVVQEVNGEVRDVSGESIHVGDRVVWAVAVSCGACFFCTHGLPQKCESLRKYGHEPITPQCGPVGGLSTHCHLLRGTAIVKVPAELPDEVAAPAGCATATVTAMLRAARQRTEIRSQKSEVKRQRSEDRSQKTEECSSSLSSDHCPLSSVVVFGLGMLGLTACAWADSLGLSVIACDVNDDRLAQAARFGAKHLAKPEALSDTVQAITHGRGADAALELSGSADAARAALDVLRIGGIAVWAGAVFPTPAVPVLPEMVVRRCLTLTGVHNYTPSDLADAVRFLTNNHTRFPFAELVAKTFPLAEVNNAFRFAEVERPVRIAVACS